MESGIFKYRHTVVEAELDEMNHVNNLQYLRWCIKAAVAHSTDVGWSPQRYHEWGFGFIVREHKIKYRIPAQLGDEVVIHTWIDSLEKVSSIRRYQILRASDGKKFAEAETTWVYVNLKSLALTRIPMDIKESFRAGIEDA